MKQQDEHPGAILLVEDETADAALIKRAFERAGVKNPVIHVTDGERAMAYLLGMDKYADRLQYPLPILILLDLKMPRMTGLEFLQWLRTRRELRKIPVVVLTGDSDPQTVNGAYHLGANSYLLKSPDSTEVLRVVKVIQEYWLQLNEPPRLVLAANSQET